MSPMRTLRYYASIPKIILLFAIFAGMAAVCWMGRETGALQLFAWLLGGLFALFALAVLLWLFITILLRTPILEINDRGATYYSPARPWRHTTVPWDEIARLDIEARRDSHRIKSYYLAVWARDPERDPSALQQFNVIWYSAPEGVVMVVPLDWLFLWAWRRRRARMLERIKTTFAPEIIKYDITVGEKERAA